MGLNLTDVNCRSVRWPHDWVRPVRALFSNRLFNFSGSGEPDSTMEYADMVKDLQSFCPQGEGDGNTTASLDRNSTDAFDNHYFVNLLANRGLLSSDQALFSSDEAPSTTKALVEAYSNNKTLFFVDFASSMVKMGSIDVLTGTSGQVRKKSRVLN